MKVKVVGAVFFVILFAVAARAESIVFESASLVHPGQSSSGVILSGSQWAGARFTLDQTTEIGGIGGHLTTLSGTLWGAIIPLLSPDALPNFLPSQIQQFAIRYVIFNNGAPSNDVIVPLQLSLLPGSYALVFGGGEPALTADQNYLLHPFGATGAGRMPFDQTPLPGASFFFATPGGNNGAQGWIDSTDSDTYRFVVAGSPVSKIPEPFSVLTLGTGMMAVLLFRKTSAPSK